jgi:hypothetical protein
VGPSDRADPFASVAVWYSSNSEVCVPYSLLLQCLARVHARSAQKEAALPAAVVVGAGAMLASPLAAQAAVTPSLQNFLYSLVAGATVLAAIAGAITLVSNFDPVSRE